MLIPSKKFSGDRDPLGDDRGWSRRDVLIAEPDGKVVHQQRGVEAPAEWSDLAVQQPSKLYFRVVGGVREDSVRGMVRRVATAVADASLRPDVGGPLFDPAGAEVFARELAELTLSQRFAWNTPVWINAGAPLPPGEKPQCGACFIQSVRDDMESITALQVSETMLFRRGSGTGTNFSPLRPAGSGLSRGGTASGPVSFMLGFDAWAGVTKSGGSSRRAAKMNILNVDHPDIRRFVESKVEAGRMIRALVGAGWSPDFNAPATSWARYQNGNHSVRITPEFMKAVADDAPWDLRFNGIAVDRIRARDLWRDICRAARETGDPGLQFDFAINDMNTCPAGGRIDASNPCSEFYFLNDSACDLGSLNLVKFYGGRNIVLPRFHADDFADACRTAIISLEAIVSLSGYPTPRIAENSRKYRPVGLGYSNLGALLMRAGLPYGSPEGRGAAAAVTSLMAAVAYETSAEISRDCGGPFPEFRPNAEAMLRVVRKHVESARALLGDRGHAHYTLIPDAWIHVAEKAVAKWESALRLGEKHGFRNAQGTLLAPTGTISFMMDCDTTGVEPDVGLVRSKKLAGGGRLETANGSVRPALLNRGATPAEADNVVKRLAETGELRLPSRLSGLRDLFACAFVPPGQPDAWPLLRPEDHVRMIAAVQPFLSGGVSKTVNLPADASADDVGEIYALAERSGLKAVAVYVDGSKGSQPLTVGKGSAEPSEAAAPAPAAEAAPADPAAAPGQPGRPRGEVRAWGERKKMPEEAWAVRRRFRLAGHDLYVHVGFFPDGAVGEFFFTTDAKDGATMGGTLDALARAVSGQLQFGCPLEKVLDDFAGTAFEPSGWTGDPEFPRATSFLDAVSRWARARFLPSPWRNDVSLPPVSREGFAQVVTLLSNQVYRVGDLVSVSAGGVASGRTGSVSVAPDPGGRATLSGPRCPRGCGRMTQTGTCWSCPSCGDSSGGCG